MNVLEGTTHCSVLACVTPKEGQCSEWWQKTGIEQDETGEKIKPDCKSLREKSEFYSGYNRKSLKDFKQKRHINWSIFFVLLYFVVLFLIDIFIETIVDYLAVLRNNTERSCA